MIEPIDIVSVRGATLSASEQRIKDAILMINVCIARAANNGDNYVDVIVPTNSDNLLKVFRHSGYTVKCKTTNLPFRYTLNIHW